jgi:uncharacterized protein (DUF433 family)
MPTKVRNIVRRLGRERIDQLVADYELGRTTIELMADYGLSKTSVIHLLEANEVALRRQPLTREQLDAAICLYQEGHALVAIEKIINVSRESIRRGLIEASVTMRPRGGSRARATKATTSL